VPSLPVTLCKLAEMSIFNAFFFLTLTVLSLGRFRVGSRFVSVVHGQLEW